MPKLKNVGADELAKLLEAASDIGQEAAYCHRRIEQGYVDKIPEPLHKATILLGASRSLADMAHAILLKGQMEEQRRELESDLRKRTAPGD